MAEFSERYGSSCGSVLKFSVASNQEGSSGVSSESSSKASFLTSICSIAGCGDSVDVEAPATCNRIIEVKNYLCQL